MLKLNPYAKTARRNAILKHNPEVRAAWTGHYASLALIATWKYFFSPQIKAKMLKPKKKPRKKVEAAKPKA